MKEAKPEVKESYEKPMLTKEGLLKDITAFTTKADV
jgi:hypothetical protein